MKTRWAIYKQGYVTKNGEVTDPILIKTKFERPNIIAKNCFIIQEIFDGLYWFGVEGTEEYN